MKEMLLLGAGASVEADVPDAFGMTQSILDLFKKNAIRGRYYEVLCCVIGGLLFQKGQNGANPFEGVNVEDVFNAIQLLGSRTELEAAAFIGSWHPIIEKLDTIRIAARRHDDSTKRMQRGSISRKINDEFKRVLEGKTTSIRIGDMVKEMVEGPMRSFMRKEPQPERMEPGRGRVFRDTNEYMIRTLVDLTWIQDDCKVDYLVPLAKWLGSSSATVATLNYDNTLELAFSRAGIPLSSDGDDDPSAEMIIGSGTGTLLKLHGSIDWCLTFEAATEQKPFSSQKILRATEQQIKEKGFRPAVVFGQRNKLTSEGPFLKLLRQFVDELSLANRLTVIGYSFRDEHINEYIRQWMNGDQAHSLRIVNGPHFKDSAEEMANTHVRMTGRVEVIPELASAGIRRLFEA